MRQVFIRRFLCAVLAMVFLLASMTIILAGCGAKKEFNDDDYFFTYHHTKFDGVKVDDAHREYPIPENNGWKEYGGGTATTDNQVIYSFQGSIIENKSSAGVTVAFGHGSIDFFNMFQANISLPGVELSASYQHTEQEIKISGTSVMLEKKGLSVKFFYRCAIVVYEVTNRAGATKNLEIVKTPEYGYIIYDEQGKIKEKTCSAKTDLDEDGEQEEVLYEYVSERYQDGSRFAGYYTFKFGERPKKNGEGIISYENKSTFEGSFINDKKSGKGKLTWSNEAYYDGDWEDNLYNGHGVLRWKSGFYYDGEFSKGEHVWENCTLYQSENELHSGNFRIRRGEKTLFEANFKDGKLHGESKHYSNDGELLDTRKWINGVPE